MSAVAKIQALIDMIPADDGDDNKDDVKENSASTSDRLAVAPKPKPSTSDIDPSSIKVVILGCGLVVPPIIEYLNFYGYRVIIATRSPSKADAIIKKGGITNPQIISVEKLDITSASADNILDRLCREGNIIISLLPYIYHVKAAKYALKYSKHFCTSSYISDAMLELKQEVLNKNLLFLNECGVDPGLDHMSAMKIIDDVHDNNGKIISFLSICGGLPAPECNDNPFGYKFSWAPRGVLLASKNNAKQLIDNKIKTVQGINLFHKDNVYKEKLKLIGNVEWYYNRDSVKYIDIYGIKEIRTMIRGTYRYVGWCETMKAIADLHLTSDQNIPTTNKSFKQYFAEFLKINKDNELSAELGTKLNLDPNCTAVKNICWLGLYSDDIIPTTVDPTPIDVLCSLCLAKLKYAPGEKDMIILKHMFEIEFADGWRESRESILLDFGLQPNDNSSMARTVSLPLAVGVRALIEGRIKKRGVLRPVYRELYEPILNECSDLGITFKETTLKPLVWIRDEVKPGERRVPISPVNCKKMIDAGFRIYVEESKTRCIDDNQYKSVGCKLVPTGSWINDAPYSAFIFGLKELPDLPKQLKHRHIYFGHAFKGQNEAIPLLNRFKAGGGELLDLEYLTSNGRRVAAFGRAAGMVGMAMGIIIWCKQQLNDKLNEVKPWKSEKEMIAECVNILNKVKKKPSVIIIGALGRCGGGAVHIAKSCKLTNITEWDLNETATGGPFKTIINDHNIFINCIRLTKKIPPFITKELCINNKDRKLSVISDVACDPNNPNNPVPVYNEITTMFKPVRRVIDDDKMPLDVTAIDHLPSLIPLEASQQYSDDLISTLLELKNRKSDIWLRARNIYLQNIAKLPTPATGNDNDNDK